MTFEAVRDRDRRLAARLVAEAAAALLRFFSAKAKFVLIPPGIVRHCNVEQRSVRRVVCKVLFD